MTVKALAKNKGGRPIGSKKAIPPQVARDVGNLDTPAQVKALIQRLANHCVKGELGTLQISCLNGLLMTWIRVFEMNDVAKRLNSLEKKIDKSIRKGRIF